LKHADKSASPIAYHLLLLKKGANQMAIIADYWIGECHVIIHDDYIVKDPEEIEKIKKRMAEIYYTYRLKELEERSKQEKQVS